MSQSEKRNLVPITRPLVAYVMWDNNSMELEPFGNVHAMDAATGDVVATGLSLTRCRELEGVVLAEASWYFPKWRNYRRMTRDELFPDFEDYIRNGMENR